jgi:hypothetical protein
MSRVGRNMSLLLRCERLIARRRFAVARQQTLVAGMAIIAAGTGLVMLNLAAYYTLAQALGSPGAALIVGLVNFALAGALYYLSSAGSGEPELAPVMEMRDAALADLEADLETAVAEVQDVAGGLRRLARDPLGGLAQDLLLPLMTGLLETMRERRETATPAENTGGEDKT